MKLPLLLTLVVLGLSSATSSHAAAVDCDQACLRAFTERYLKALVRSDHVSVLGSDVRYTENGQVMRPEEGLWKRASALGVYRRYLEDPETQQAMFIGTLDESGSPALVALRLGIRGGKIAEVETIVARKGSHPLFAPEDLVEPAELWSEAVSRVRSRAELVSVANSYFEGLERHDSSVIAAATTCRRIENGVQTTQRYGDASANCAASASRLRYIKAVRNRRFPLVDPQNGIVVATVLFDIPGETPSFSGGMSATASRLPPDPDDSRVRAALRQPRTLLLTELFKIENDKIQEIEAVMHNLPPGSTSGWPD